MKFHCIDSSSAYFSHACHELTLDVRIPYITICIKQLPSTTIIIQKAPMYRVRQKGCPDFKVNIKKQSHEVA